MIALSGNLAFGTYPVDVAGTRTLTISNNGTSAPTVTSINLSPHLLGAYYANWAEGTIAPGSAQQVTICFWPPDASEYNGTLFVIANQTSGTDTIAVSGNGAYFSPEPPPTKCPF